MVEPSIRAGQRRRRISWCTRRGRLGSMRTVSATSAPKPAAAASRKNLRLLVGSNANQSSGFTVVGCTPNLRITRDRSQPYYDKRAFFELYLKS